VERLRLLPKIRRRLATRLENALVLDLETTRQTDDFLNRPLRWRDLVEDFVPTTARDER
jgi:hypothetical protein